MEVVVENLGGLKRKFTITIPLEKVSSTYEACYQKLKSKVKVNGFRQGAFPKKLMEKRFKESMGQEALETLIPEHFQAALTQESTESATQPKFDSLNIEKNKPLAFVATFEATPTFDVSLEGLSLDKKEIVITDEEKAERRASLLKEHATFGTKDGAAEEKDQVTMDFAPSEGQESFGNGNDRAEGHVYIVGSKQLLPEFEEALLGMKAGENKDFPLTFPADY
ncbi:MAG: trigger factor, partial [bacterium]